jgi:hypothetical protein
VKFKKVLGVVAAGALSLSLAACSSTPPKEQLVNGLKAIGKTTSYESNTDFKLNVSIPKEKLEDSQKVALDAVNQSILTFKSIVDVNAQKEEADLSAKFKLNNLALSVDLPVLVDNKTDKVYVKPDSIITLVDTLQPGTGAMLESLKGKLLELDAKQSSQVQMNELSTYLSSKEFKTDLNDAVFNILNAKDEKQFTEVGKNQVKVTFTAAEIRSLIETLANKMITKLPKDSDVTPADLKKELKSSLDDFFKSVDFKEFSLVATFDGKNITDAKFTISADAKDKAQTGNITTTFDFGYDNNLVKSANFDVKVSGKDPELGNVSFGLTANTTYDKVNQQVKFNIDPSKEKIMTQEQLMQMFMGSVGTSSSGIE